jgi:hypothetical protein
VDTTLPLAFIAQLADAEVPLSSVKDGTAFGYNGTLYVNPAAGSTIDLVAGISQPRLAPTLMVRVAKVDKLLR